MNLPGRQTGKTLRITQKIELIKLPTIFDIEPKKSLGVRSHKRPDHQLLNYKLLNFSHENGFRPVRPTDPINLLKACLPAGLNVKRSDI